MKQMGSSDGSSNTNTSLAKGNATPFDLIWSVVIALALFVSLGRLIHFLLCGSRQRENDVTLSSPSGVHLQQSSPIKARTVSDIEQLVEVKVWPHVTKSASDITTNTTKPSNILRTAVNELDDIEKNQPQQLETRTPKPKPATTTTTTTTTKMPRKPESIALSEDDDDNDASSSSSSFPAPPLPPRRQHKNLANQECCYICLTHFHSGDKICQSKNPSCTHKFHFSCMAEWLSAHNDCPVCRVDYILYSSHHHNNNHLSSPSIPVETV